uniref:Enhancer of mRNA-decapping protein 4 C-terminal domain-containing protein n=1 Tax=Hemiselmis andersenii TaxID=464988 RepID=A0A6U4NC72_HEMAN
MAAVYEKVSGLVMAEKWEEAFQEVLSQSDLRLVVWLCKSTQPQRIFATRPPSLTPPVVLSLVQQLGFDLSSDAQIKVQWLGQAVMALDPKDPTIGPHVPGILRDVLGKLSALEVNPAENPVTQENDFRVLMHVVRSMSQ